MILSKELREEIDTFSGIDHGIVHDRSQALIDYACTFGAWAHDGQVRKYTNEPYINHPIAVAKIVATRTDDVNMLCAALLHDTIEDTDVDYDMIVNAGFGRSIADLVVELTDVAVPEDGDRATRKGIERDRLAKVSDNAQTVKLADLIHNTLDIAKHDKNFAVVYMKEKEALLNVLTRGDHVLLNRAWRIVNKWKDHEELCS